MSLFFSSLYGRKMNKYDTKKLSTLEKLNKTLQKEISNCHELLHEIQNEIWSTRLVYSSGFHRDPGSTEGRDKILNELINKKKNLITKLESFEKRMKDVSSSLPKQTSIREDASNELEKELSYVLKKHLNEDAKNKVLEYIGEFDLLKDHAYSEKDTRKRKIRGGKSKKQRKSRKSRKNK